MLVSSKVRFTFILQISFLLSFCHSGFCKPEQIHISLLDDSSDIAVTWSTKEDKQQSIVEYGFENNATVQSAVGTVEVLIAGIGPLSRQYIHKVVLKSLLPRSKYWYRCGGAKAGWSKYYKFETLPKGSSWKPRLAIYGDLGSVNAQIVDNLADAVQKKKIDLILHAGDIAYDLHLDEGKVGDRFLRMIEPIASRVPYMVAPGNHESFRNFTNYKSRFYMPGKYENMMYSFTVGPVLVIAVSTEVYYLTEYGGQQSVITQYQWLENLLKEANKNRSTTPWIVVFGHRPMYCSNNILRGCAVGVTKVRMGMRSIGGKGLEKLLYDYGVDLVFWGHQHSYERMWPIYEKAVFNGTVAKPYINSRAPIHIIAGCAGNSEIKHNFVKEAPSWSAFTSTNYGYVRLTAVNTSNVRLEYISTEQGGKVIDDVWVIKDKHGPYPELYPHDQGTLVQTSLARKFLIWT